METLIKAIFIILMFPSVLWGACSTTVTCTLGETGTCRQPADNTLAKVQECVDASAAGDGTVYVDGVYLNTDPQDWAGALDIKGKHGLVIKGNPTGKITTTSSTTSIISAATATKKFRITGCGFVLIPGTSRSFEFAAPENFRFDHNSILGSHSKYILGVTGAIGSGVIDSNTIGSVASPYDGTAAGLIYREGTSNHHAANVDFTDFATNKDWVFVEGNVINSGCASGCEWIENDDGGHIYSRYNTFNEVSGRQGVILEQHNRSQGWGGRAQVFHNNKMILTQNNVDTIMLVRNGTALIYNNLIDYSARNASFTPLEIRNYRAWGGVNNDAETEYNCATYTNAVDAHTPAGPNFTGTMLGRCCSSAWTTSGYAGEGVPCVGPGIGVWGATNPYEPLYIWNNHKTADGTTMADIDAILTPAQESAWAIRSTYEYCISTDSATPSSCGTHSLSYTAPACPHPLTGLSGGCNPSIAGAGGYNYGNTTLGSGASMSIGSGAVMTLH